MQDNWRDGNNQGIAILRVSSHRQKDNISHDVQEKEIREYCARNRIELVTVHRIVESAKDSDDRKKFQGAILTALADDVRHLLFYMYDRESRNLTDNEKNEKLVKAGLIVIHYVRDGKVLHKDSSDSDFFIRDMHGAMSKQFIRNLSAKVGDAMREKARQGWYPGSHVPLGYVQQKNRDADGKELKRGTTIAKDPDESKVKWVRREFELRSLGYTLDQIREAVIQEGLVPASRAKTYWKSNIDYRLKNPFYWGRFSWETKEYEGKHEVIISKTVLERVKRVNEGKRIFLFGLKHGIFGGGWIKCGKCGCNVIYDPKKKVARTSGKVTVFHYYHCTNGRGLHLTQTGMNIHERVIWEQMDRAVDSITITPALAKQIAHALSESHRRSIGENLARIQELKATVVDIDQREDKAYELLANASLDAEGFRRVVDRLRKERQTAKSQLESLEGAKKGQFRENAASTLELAKCAKSLYLSRTEVERREFLERLVSNPVLDGSTIRYDLQKPFGVLARMNGNEKWWALVDEFRTDLGGLSDV